MRVGIIGFGRMGKALSRKLVDKGFEVHVWNRTLRKTLGETSVSIEKSPRLVAENADVVIISVSNNEAAMSVLMGKKGVYESGSDAIIAMLSTITPITSQYLYKKSLEKRIIYVEAPVLGGPKAILEGKLVSLIAGSEGIEKIRGVYSVFSSKTYYIGKIPLAMATKLAFNSLFLTVLEGFGESLSLAKKWGVAPELLREIASSTWTKCIFEKYFDRGLKRKGEATFTLKLAGKDLYYAVNASWKKKAFTPVIAAALQSFMEAINNGYGENDYPQIMRFLLGK